MATVAPGQTLTVQAEIPRDWTLADLQRRLGGIPADRIRLYPPPGCATEQDVLEIQAHEDRLCELEDGILVEKAMGWYESLVAALILTQINKFLEEADLGIAFGADATLKILPGVVKIPDVSFVSWDRWPKVTPPRRPIPAIVPDLTVEVLSETNTPAEMDEKLAAYFRAGVCLVWYVDPSTRSARAMTSVKDVQEIGPDHDLDGGNVLPGFRLSLRHIFDEADRQGPRHS